MKKYLLIVLSLILIFIGGCSAATYDPNNICSCSAVSSETSFSTQSQPQESSTKATKEIDLNQKELPDKNTTPISLPLPFPCSDMFDLIYIDAFIFDIVVQEISTKAIRPDGVGKDSLYAPSIIYIDSYINKDDTISYLCFMNEFYYYGLAYGLNDLDDPRFFFGIGGSPARYIIDFNPGGMPVLISVDTIGDGASYVERKKFYDKICGPKTDLAKMLLDEKPLPNLVEVTPRDPAEYLRIYIDYYFR